MTENYLRTLEKRRARITARIEKIKAKMVPAAKVAAKVTTRKRKGPDLAAAMKTEADVPPSDLDD